MNEDGAQMEKQPGTDDDLEAGAVRRRWMLGLLLATFILIVLAVGAYFLFGRELFQRPLLIVAVVITWLGALVGLTVGSEPSYETERQGRYHEEEA